MKRQNGSCFRFTAPREAKTRTAATAAIFPSNEQQQHNYKKKKNPILIENMQIHAKMREGDKITW